MYNTPTHHLHPILKQREEVMRFSAVQPPGIRVELSSMFHTVEILCTNVEHLYTSCCSSTEDAQNGLV